MRIETEETFDTDHRSEQFIVEDTFELSEERFPISDQRIQTVQQLNEFVVAQHDEIQRLVRSQCFQTPELAEDAFQNIYSKLVEFLSESSEGIRQPWAFIRVAARRAAIDESRKAAVLSRRFVPLYEDSLVIADDIKDPDRTEYDDRLIQAVRFLLTNLRTREQAVLTGIFLEGKSGRDVAREMQLSESYVAEIKVRALSQLRELIRDAENISEWPD